MIKFRTKTQQLFLFALVLCVVEASAVMGFDESVAANSSCVAGEQFDCGEGSSIRCISSDLVCDNVNDCGNKNDEANCLHMCLPGEYMCRDGACIQMNSRCDGTPDCVDGADEKGCVNVGAKSSNSDEVLFQDEISPPHAASLPIVEASVVIGFNESIAANSSCVAGEQFDCGEGSSIRCISSDLVCDNVNDCGNKNDEANCLHMCLPGEYMCRDGACIQMDSRCDGTPDCVDGADEKGCVNVGAKSSNSDEVLFQDEISPPHAASLPTEDSLPTTASLPSRASVTTVAVTSPTDVSFYPEISFVDEPKFVSSPCVGTLDFYCGENSENKCISSYKICDNIKHCSNGKDEENCMHQCPSDRYMCQDGGCINPANVCDGKFDCMDGSDERGCEEVRKPVCESPYNFFCKADDKCISVALRCDGEKDCDSGEDEIGCSRNNCLGKESFACGQSGLCINKSQVCDGNNDCPNGFDEIDCLGELPNADDFLTDDGCKLDEFQCLDGACISQSQVCNKVPDCKGGEDEGGQCDKCDGYGCGEKCNDYPSGPKCSCPPNMILSADEKSCYVSTVSDDKLRGWLKLLILILILVIGLPLIVVAAILCLRRHPDIARPVANFVNSASDRFNSAVRRETRLSSPVAAQTLLKKSQQGSQKADTVINIPHAFVNPTFVMDQRLKEELLERDVQLDAFSPLGIEKSSMPSF